MMPELVLVLLSGSSPPTAVGLRKSGRLGAGPGWGPEGQRPGLRGL